MTDWIKDTAALEALYGKSSLASKAKVADRLTPEYRAWVEASPFCAVSTVGPEGLDCSPRGDDGPVVKVLDERHLAMPDWRGNNRLDSLRNIVRDPRVSLMFVIPRAPTIIRVNGEARITTDPALVEQFEQRGKHPASVLVTRIDEIYFQCAKSVLRAKLWEGGIVDPATLPSQGDMLKAMVDGFDGTAFDAEWPDRAKETMW
jgi:PPOX class probable FMN-dependent enzyme